MPDEERLLYLSKIQLLYQMGANCLDMISHCQPVLGNTPIYRRLAAELLEIKHDVEAIDKRLQQFQSPVA